MREIVAGCDKPEALRGAGAGVFRRGAEDAGGDVAKADETIKIGY
jgi:hypothetical protein